MASTNTVGCAKRSRALDDVLLQGYGLGGLQRVLATGRGTISMSDKRKK